jgi:hypothetical protein
VQVGWLRCAAAPAADDCLRVADGSPYTLLNGDVNHRMKSLAAATNPDGANSEDSAPTELIDALPPTPLSAPVISGSAQDGHTLSSTDGSWNGSTPLVFSYQWQRCDMTGENCDNISSANQADYVLTSADVSHTLRAQVTADNSSLPGGGSSDQLTAASDVIQADAPGPVDPPQISGPAYDGRSLTASTGSWSGSEPFVFSYQWLTCDNTGANCSNYGGATSQNWVLPEDMIGRTAKVRAQASNQGLPGGGTADQTSDASQVIAQATPTNTALPGLSGTAAEDDVLEVSDGTWLGAPPISFTYQWQQCHADGSNCANLPEATSSSYTAETSDIGFRLRAVVTATNSSSSVTANSALSDIVVATPDPPVNTSVPTLSGVAQAGSLLNASSGSWTGRAPISYSYQWQLCSAGGSGCSDITSADSETYQLQSSDVGGRVRVVVRAANSDGSDLAQSVPSAIVESLAPVNQEAPYVSGAEVEPSSLTAHPGQWAGAGPIDYSYQWQACRGSDCPVVGTASKLAVTADQIGAYIQLSVTASNSYGEASSTSSKYGPIEPSLQPPSNNTLPLLSGSSTVGGILSSSAGQWQGSAPINFTYHWLRCKTDQLSSCQQSLPASSDLSPYLSSGALDSSILTADNSSYSVTEADRGYRIRSQLDAVNAAGTTSAFSAASSVVGSPSCLTVGASSSAVIKLKGRKVYLYQRLQAVAGSNKPFRLRAKSSRTISWAWRLNDIALRSGRSRSISASAANSRLRVGKNNWTLTVRVGKYRRTIKRASYVTQCPANKTLTPKPKSVVMRVGSWRGRASISSAYAALKPGVWQLTGRHVPSRAWYLDGKKISSRSKVSLSPARLKLGKHKILLRVRKGRSSKSASWSVTAK